MGNLRPWPKLRAVSSLRGFTVTQNKFSNQDKLVISQRWTVGSEAKMGITCFTLPYTPLRRYSLCSSLSLIRSLVSWKYMNLSIAKCFGLLCKGIFARCRWIITKLLRKSRCHLQWPSRTHTWQSHRFSCNHPRLPPNFVVFWPTPYFTFLRISFCLSDRSFISCFTAFTFSVVQGDTIWIHHLYY